VSTHGGGGEGGGGGDGGAAGGAEGSAGGGAGGGGDGLGGGGVSSPASGSSDDPSSASGDGDGDGDASAAACSRRDDAAVVAVPSVPSDSRSRPTRPRWRTTCGISSSQWLAIALKRRGDDGSGVGAGVASRAAGWAVSVGVASGGAVRTGDIELRAADRRRGARSRPCN